MKRKTLLNVLIALFVILVIGFIYDYTFNGEHRDIASEAASASLSAKELYMNFESNENAATANYLDKVIEVRGLVSDVETNILVLDDQILANFNPNEMPKLVKGNQTTIKGRCVGYDELLEMVKIDQATLINK